MMAFRLFKNSALPVGRRVSFYSTESGASPLMAKFRSDLKDAMRAKETNRLNVLRSLLSEITNSTKSPTSTHTGPITDSVVLKIMNKALSTAQSSLEDYAKANRQDLVDKQNGQIKVLQEYLGMIKTASKEDIEKVVDAIVKEVGDEGKKVFGEVMRETLKRLEGRNAVPKVVSDVVKEALAKL